MCKLNGWMDKDRRYDMEIKGWMEKVEYDVQIKRADG